MTGLSAESSKSAGREPLMLATHAAELHVFPALKAVALGYLLKHSAAEDVLLSTRQAYLGETVLHPAIARMVLQELRCPVAWKQSILARCAAATIFQRVGINSQTGGARAWPNRRFGSGGLLAEVCARSSQEHSLGNIKGKGEHSIVNPSTGCESVDAKAYLMRMRAKIRVLRAHLAQSRTRQLSIRNALPERDRCLPSLCRGTSR